MTSGRISGIYMIRCTPTQKVYIGQSVDTHRRFVRHHKPDLRGGHHCNSYLQRAWDKYGESSFEFRVLREDTGDLDFWESFYQRMFSDTDRAFGYNMSQDNGTGGYRHSAETCKKIGDGHRGKIVSEATRKKLSEAQIGTHRSAEFAQKMRTINGERTRSHAHRAAMGLAMRAKWQDPEFRTMMIRTRTKNKEATNV